MNNAYFQIGWIGVDGLEAAVLGLNFIPREVKEILMDPSIYLVGRDIHADIKSVLWPQKRSAVELSVLTLDLPDSSKGSDPMKTGLGSLTYEATSV